MDEAEACLAAVAAHERLAHYLPTAWVEEGAWRVNMTLHDKKAGAEEARIISRLLAGGQGLRAGDSRVAARATCQLLRPLSQAWM